MLIRAYAAFIAMLNMFALECNNCHRRGECIRHGYYERGYLLTVEDVLAGTRIRILRVRCKHCGKTHAILPEEIIPYLRFTATFIGSALKRYYTRMLCDGCNKKESVEMICWDMAIEVPQLYCWKKRFEAQKDRIWAYWNLSGTVRREQWSGLLNERTTWWNLPENTCEEPRRYRCRVTQIRQIPGSPFSAKMTFCGNHIA